MARKLYIFGIGGTGSRVIKSLAMLLAAGVKLENGFDTVVPIIIDPDTENGDLNRTKDILRLYQEVRNQIKDADDFYKQELKTVNELADPKNKTISPDYFQFKLNNVDSTTFGQYIGFDSLCDQYKNSKDDKSFVKLLYSNSNLNSDLSIGFKGNPNMGSIVLNQFTNSEDFKRFGQTFGPEDAIFIINSIFGGTGAAGFPLLLKNLRGNPNLLNFAQIKDAPIGGLTYLPYFTLDKKGEINAESFEEKAKIAIDYYNRTIINQRKINVLHLVGNRGNTNAEEYAVGGAEQKNKAHFLEVAGALSIIEFCKNIGSYTCNNGQTTRATEIKEFGIERANENISFDDLNIDNKEQLYVPLSKFRLFTQYLNEGLERAKNVSRWTKSNFFVLQKQKKSPCNPAYFDTAEYKNQVVAFNKHFKDWIDELSKNKPAFSPFFDTIPNNLYTKIDTQNCLNIDNLQLRSEKDTKTGKPKQIHTTLIRLFGISTGKVYQKLPVRVNNEAEKVIKVFRLHQGQEGTGWFVSAAIDKDALRTIKTEGKDIASSIPSPFARIDLVKSAFDWINYQMSSIVGAYPQGVAITREDKIKIREIIEGKTAQNKLISDALDVAQMFYKYPVINDKIEIIAWKPKDRFKDLIENSLNNRQKIFAETLSIYWEQDSVSQANQGNLILYNFEHVNRLFFIINKNTKQIIGATSPATLFFSAPDARNAINGLDIRCGQDILLDDIYFPLHKREVSFIEYMYAFAKQSNNFSILFPEVYTYLKNIEEYLLDDSIRAVVANLTNENINNYQQCHLSYDEKDYCEILSLRLGTEKSFLEDKIIELPYSIDSSKFKTCGSKKHLLPVTQAFIRQYGIENIEQYCKIEERAGGGVEAILDVPVQNGTLSYRKLYHIDDIIKLDIHLAIMPFIRTNHIPLKYTMALLDPRVQRNDNVEINAFENGERVEIGTPIIRKSGNDNTIQSKYMSLNQRFNSISVNIKNSVGFVVPKLPEKNGQAEIQFAIDFGTTNTHIEYKVPNAAEKGFENTSDTPIWQSLIDLNTKQDPMYLKDNLNFDKELFPYLINNNSITKFPFRTSLTTNENIDFTKPLIPFNHSNCFLLFEKEPHPTYFNLQTKLKWSNYKNPEDKILVESYIECMLQLILFKTLLLNGDPKKSKVIWFYPVSMDTFELGVFFEVWQDAYVKTFNIGKNYQVLSEEMKKDVEDHLIAIPESIAPYLFYKGSNPGLSLSIDIGGGSSDIALFEKESNKPIFISSFKFAGNAIFGDGYPQSEFENNSDLNGFVKSFLSEVKKAINNNPKKLEILDDIILARKDSADFSSFLFSLENDPAFALSYTKLLRQNKFMKLPIMIFYGAICYYSATLIKKSGCDIIPKNILLSGTASKTILIVDSSGKRENISKLFKFIFEKVNNSYSDDMKVVITEAPKEITCKGALKSGITHDIKKTPIKFWIGGNTGIWSQSIDKREDISITPEHSKVNNAVEKEIAESIETFYCLMDEFVNQHNIEETFGISTDAYEIFKEQRSKYVIDFLYQGLNAFHKNRSDNKKIEETLFFYPLIGIMNKLAFELSQTNE